MNFAIFIALAPQMASARALLGELLSNRGMFEEAARPSREGEPRISRPPFSN